jgi:hypothetical protein
MATFFGHPVHPICRLVISVLWGYLESRVFQMFGRLTQSQTENSSRKKCHINCHIREMESVMNRVHQRTNLDGRYLTGVVLKSNVVLTFLNKGKHLSFSSHNCEYI